MRRIGELLPRSVRRANDRTTVLAAVVLDAARRALDESLPAAMARRVSPVAFREGTLHVAAEGSVVGSEVRLLGERVVTATRRILLRRGFHTEVADLRVRVR